MHYKFVLPIAAYIAMSLIFTFLTVVTKFSVKKYLWFVKWFIHNSERDWNNFGIQNWLWSQNLTIFGDERSKTFLPFWLMVLSLKCATKVGINTCQYSKRHNWIGVWSSQYDVIRFISTYDIIMFDSSPRLSYPPEQRQIAQLRVQSQSLSLPVLIPKV